MLLGAFLCGGLALPMALRAQTSAATIAVNDFRPLASAVSRLEQLSGIPINYEDIRCDFPGDQKDMTAENVTPAQQQLAQKNGFGPVKDIAPRGGPLSAAIAVDAVSGQLRDANALAGALNSVLSVYSGSNLPGAFQMESYHGAFFVAPIKDRDATGATVSVTPVLSTPITISVKNGVALHVLDQIVAEVYKGSGHKIGVGSVPINGMAMGRVTLEAVHEPASHVLLWLMNSLLGYGPAIPAASPGLSYRVLYDPQLKYYMFNMVEVGVGLNTHTYRQPEPPHYRQPVPPQPFGPKPSSSWSTPVKQ
jgi:hypothetical protein